MKFNLEDRLVRYSVSIHEIIDLLPNDRAGAYMAAQLIRSGTAPALLYGEALAAESRKDFVHKMKIALKELRESLISLKIIRERNYTSNTSKTEAIILENNELISIFVKSIQTAQLNMQKSKQPQKS
jgi:four helix bundle protein